MDETTLSNFERKVLVFLVRLEAEQWAEHKRPGPVLRKWGESATALLHEIAPHGHTPGYDPKTGFEAQATPKGAKP